MQRKTFGRIFCLLSLLWLTIGVQAQNYISLHKDEIRIKMQQEFPGFDFVKEVHNTNRSFIKYENQFEDQTLLFRLNEDGFCTTVSRMYNTWLFNRLKQQFAGQFGDSKNLKWTFEEDGRTFEMELVKGEWFVTVITRLKQ